MNTNLEQMSSRCPGAVSLGTAELLGYNFRFAYHADVVPDIGQQVTGVLWKINSQHLQSLDLFEGYPVYYTRSRVTVLHKGKQISAHCYMMQPGQEDAPPSGIYFESIVRGYRDHSIPMNQLLSAVDRVVVPN